MLFAIIGVMISEAIFIYREGGVPTMEDVWKGWLSFILSCLMALMAYGNLHSQFKYNDKQKPPILKRMVTALSMGMSWKTLLGLIK